MSALLDSNSVPLALYASVLSNALSGPHSLLIQLKKLIIGSNVQFFYIPSHVIVSVFRIINLF